MITERVPKPADELYAALSGPSCLKNEGGERVADLATVLAGLGEPLAAAFIFGMVGDLMAGLQGLLVKQEQIVGEHHEMSLGGPGHQAGGPGLLLAQLILQLIEDLFHVPAPPV